MEKNYDLSQILKEIQSTNDGVTKTLVPILKDTINDYKKLCNKIIVILVLLILTVIGITGTSLYLLSEQNNKYNEFLSQFEFVEDTIYQSTNDYSDINSGINITE